MPKTPLHAYCSACDLVIMWHQVSASQEASLATDPAEDQVQDVCYDALCQSLSELYQSAGSACQQFVTTSWSAVVQQVAAAATPNIIVQRTKFAERAFSVAGPSVWNSPLAELILEPDTAVFKRKLKSYPFCSIYSVIFSVLKQQW